MVRSMRLTGLTRALAAATALSGLAAPLAAAAIDSHVDNPVDDRAGSPELAAAERFTWDRIATVLPNADIATHWLPGQDRFWYKRSDGKGGTAFVLVDAATGQAKPAFDHRAIAQGLSRALGRTIKPDALPFEEYRYLPDGRSLSIAIGGKHFRCTTAQADCAAERSTAGESLSPDGRWIAFVRDYNLWIRPAAGGEAFALTSDGVRDHGYAGTSGDTMAAVSVLRSGVPGAPQILWSPDSRRILTQWIDEREVGEFHLVESVPADGSIRPKLYSYRYPLPGDKAVATARIVAFDLATRKRTDIAGDPLVAAYWNPIAGGQVWWAQDGARIYYLNRDRFYRHVGLNVADAASGVSKRLLSEDGGTNLTINWFREKPLTRTLANGDFLWFSERSGWAHLYYYRKDGTLRNAVTKGDWVVRNVLAIDEAGQRLFFSGLAHDKTRQPYDQYVYSVKFDGSELKLLTPEDADHIQMEPGISVGSNRSVPGDTALFPERTSFSPSGRYFVDSFSRPDLPPRLALRRADGSLVRMLETADASALVAAKMPLPEPFSTLAADGRTRLYGTIYKPSGFDPAKHYGVVELNYPGPQSVVNSRYFTSLFSNRIGTQDRQAMAELGFIVITMDGRGGPFRSKAFWNQSYGKMGTAGMLADHVAGLKQLAATRPWMDLGRVGIFGHSGGGYGTAQAMLTYPQVYKVGVAGAGDFDQRLYQAMWSDLYNGPDLKGLDAAITPNAAARLQGKLLMVHGEMDDNVHPAQTLRLADALMKADKDFDMLIVPGTNHLLADPSKPAEPVNAYLQRRRWRYFVRNLGGPSATATPADPRAD